MALPVSRNTTYVEGQPIKANDLNAIQDSIQVAGHGEVTDFVAMHMGNTASGTWNENPPRWHPAAAVDAAYLPLPLKPGDRLKAIKFRHLSGGAGSKSFEVYKQASNGTFTLLATWTASANPGATGVIHTSVPGTAYQLAEDESVWAIYTSGNSGDRFYGVVVTSDRPL